MVFSMTGGLSCDRIPAQVVEWCRKSKTAALISICNQYEG